MTETRETTLLRKEILAICSSLRKASACFKQAIFKETAIRTNPKSPVPYELSTEKYQARFTEGDTGKTVTYKITRYQEDLEDFSCIGS